MSNGESNNQQQTDAEHQMRTTIKEACLQCPRQDDLQCRLGSFQLYPWAFQFLQGNRPQIEYIGLL